MKGKVVVENTLTPYIEHLKSLGYDVYKLHKNSNLKNITTDEYKAIVMSGLDTLGYTEGDSNNPPSPIIEAKGRTPEEVQGIIESKFK